jgi:multidrug efflux pump subunit AcrA (membrane-fusion protein)
MRFYRQSLLGLFLAALTLGLVTLGALQIVDAVRQRGQNQGGPPAAQERVASVRVMTVTAGAVAPVIAAYGEVRARRSLEIRTPRAGRVVWTAPELATGARVSAGTPLLRLDQAEVRAALDLASADLGSRTADSDKALATLALARDELAAANDQLALRVAATARQRDLRTRDAGSATAVETAELAESSARQSVLAARQSLLAAEAQSAEAKAAILRQKITVAEARRALAETEIRADFGGILDGVSVVEGGLVGANDQIATLIDPERLDVWIRVSTGQFAELLGDAGTLRPVPVRAVLESGGTRLSAAGNVVRAGAALGEGESGRLVIATLDAAPGFRPGDFVAVTLVEPPLSGMAILPGSAIGTDGAVLALTSDDRLEALPVTILRRQGNDVIVDATALDGRDIVTARTAQTGVGIKVRPIRPDDRAEGMALDDGERARLIALVEADAGLSAADRSAMMAQLSAETVPAALVAAINARAGG